MSYRVHWRRAAKAQAADIWMRAADRATVTAASDHIDQILSQSPLDQGESRAGNRRVWVVPPLVVFYDVDDTKRSVTVIALGEISSP